MDVFEPGLDLCLVIRFSRVFRRCQGAAPLVNQEIEPLIVSGSASLRSDIHLSSVDREHGLSHTSENVVC